MLAAVSLVFTIVLVIGVGYVIGSVPIALIVARRSGISDLRTVGDHNPGYWNARERIGVRPALPIFVGDVGKGAIAAAVGVVVAGDGQWWMGYIGGGAAMIGHAWPVLARFRGGRSVLTFVGTACVVAPLPALVSWIVVWAARTRRQSFAWPARIGVVVFPVVQLVVEGPDRTAATGALMTFIGFRFGRAAITARRSARATTDADAHR